jgi:hypothetical protein
MSLEQWNTNPNVLIHKNGNSTPYYLTEQNLPLELSSRMIKFVIIGFFSLGITLIIPIINY